MPWYNDLRPSADLDKKDYALVFPNMTTEEKKRCINNLLVLRQGLTKDIQQKKSDKNLIVATWNVKEFGHTTQRLPETYFYFAEIISSFDLVALQEIKSSLDDLNILMRLLGNNWDYVMNDITEGKEGNSERSAYLFNNKRVEFAGLAGEIVLWDKLTKNSSVKQLKRTPYITGFRSGWKTFSMVNLHLHPGDEKEDIKYRKKEVELLLQAIKEKVSHKRFWNDNLILVGDYNLYTGADKDDPTIQIFYDNGFKEVESLKGLDTNASETEAYDRIFLTDNNYFRVGVDSTNKEVAGVFNPFDYVFMDGNEKTYKKFMKKQYGGSKDLDIDSNLTSYYKHPWRKNQLSDHFPIWFELIIDSSDEFLSDKLDEYNSN